MVTAAQMDFSTMSMGQIHQFTLEVVDKLCRQHRYFSDIMNRKAKYARACRKPYLEIKCREKACHCSPKKKKAIQTQTKEKMKWAMQPKLKDKQAWMHVNDTLLKYCEFYTGHSVEHRTESTLIFIKSRYIQSAIGNKTWTHQRFLIL